MPQNDANDTKTPALSNPALGPLAIIGVVFCVYYFGIRNDDSGNGWIFICSAALMGCVFAFMDFFEARGMMKKLKWRGNIIIVSVALALGVFFLYQIGMAVIPHQISTNTRIMLPVLLGLLALQFVNTIPAKSSL